MSGVFIKYQERFAPSQQGDLLKIIESDEQMFQEYKEWFDRKKIEGVCRHLCDYVTLHDLLDSKESFVQVFASTEKRH